MQLATLFCIANPASVFSETKLNLIADQVSISKDNQQVIAKGNVQIIIGDRQLFAKKIIYNRNTEQVLVYGPLEILDSENVRIFAQSAVISSDLKTAISKEVRALFQDNFQISSSEIRRDPKGITEFKNSMGTSCKICENDAAPPIWNIKSKSIIHDKAERSLVFKNAWLELGGLPLLYTPYIKTPEPGVTRASGLLTPSLISSDLLGIGIKQPFFFALTENSDLTVSLLKTNENSLIESELRALFPDESLKLKAVVEPLLSEEKFKGFINAKGEKGYSSNINLDYDITLLTNKDFLMKYNYGETDLIPNNISFNRFLDYRSEKIESYYFQSLRTPTSKEPLVLPHFNNQSVNSLADGRALLSKQSSILGLIEKEKKFVRLNQSIDLTGTRMSRKGFLIGASAALSGSIYNIWDEGNNYSQYVSMFPVLSTDLSFPMIRESSNRTEVIDPRIQLVYSPLDQVPDETNEDSIQVDFDRTNLFATNRFPGKDRQESGIWINSSINYLNVFEQNQSYGAEIGQIIRLTNFDQFSQSSALKGRKSDLLLSGFFEYSDLIRLNNSLLMTNDLDLRLSETNLSLTHGNSTLSGKLLYSTLVENTLEEAKITELTVSASSQIDDNWKSVFDVRHDIANNQTISTSAGLTFENECVDFSINLSKRFGSSDNLPEDTRFEIRFDLGGFGQKRTSSASCTKNLSL